MQRAFHRVSLTGFASTWLSEHAVPNDRFFWDMRFPISVPNSRMTPVLLAEQRKEWSFVSLKSCRLPIGVQDFPYLTEVFSLPSKSLPHCRSSAAIMCPVYAVNKIQSLAWFTIVFPHIWNCSNNRPATTVAMFAVWTTRMGRKGLYISHNFPATHLSSTPNEISKSHVYF